VSGVGAVNAPSETRFWAMYMPTMSACAVSGTVKAEIKNAAAAAGTLAGDFICCPPYGLLFISVGDRRSEAFTIGTSSSQSVQRSFAAVPPKKDFCALKLPTLRRH